MNWEEMVDFAIDLLDLEYTEDEIKVMLMDEFSVDNLTAEDIIQDAKDKL
jgi:hypothetical protein